MLELLRQLLGEAFTEEMAAQVEVYLAKEYVAVDKYQGALGATGDNEALRAEIKAELEVEYQAKLEELRLAQAVSIALIKAGAIDEDLVKVKLDFALLSLSTMGEVVGLAEQIVAVKKAYPMLFISKEEANSGLKGIKPVVGEAKTASLTKGDFSKMSYQERLELLKTNPGLYQALV